MYASLGLATRCSCAAQFDAGIRCDSRCAKPDPVAAVAACVERYDGHAFFDMNVVTGTKGFPSKAFLRALNGDVFRFHGEDYPLTPLRRAIEELYARLAGSDG